MKIKIRKLESQGVIPKYAKEGDAGLDLTATSKHYDEFGNVHYGTGISIEIPQGFVGLLFPRSSICKQDIVLSNSIGVIDSSYRGEISFKFKPSVIFADDKIGFSEISNTFDIITTPGGEFDFNDYQIGDRIGQLIILPYPQIEFEEVEELSTTERGSDGYGSTGN